MLNCLHLIFLQKVMLVFHDEKFIPFYLAKMRNILKGNKVRIMTCCLFTEFLLSQTGKLNQRTDCSVQQLAGIIIGKNRTLLKA